MLANATRICEANFGNLMNYSDGDPFRVVRCITRRPAYRATLRARTVYSLSPNREFR